MIKRFALALGLGLALTTPALSESYLNPDRAWWTAFFKAVEGVVPDFEMIAKKDPTYLAANEFDRGDVLAKLIDSLRASHSAIDVDAAEVTISIRAELGDYSVENTGFPVSIFTQNMHLKLDFNALYFRNWDDYNIFPATREEGKALRDRIGTQALAAEVTLTNFKKSTSRPNAYDGFVTKVAFFANDGLPVAEFTASEPAPLAAADAADKVSAARQMIVDAAGIPPLGTTWEQAKGIIQTTYPFVASDTFAYTDKGKIVAYRFENGTVLTDEPHDPAQPFRIYLQQIEGAWRAKSGFSADVNGLLYGAAGGNIVDFKGTGPGLSCYTPDVLDRCAVLEFSPAGGGHVLTRAYGVLETGAAVSGKAGFDAFMGANGDAFEGFTAKIDYDAESLKTGIIPKFPGVRGVGAYAAGAGEPREGEPFYNPLEFTTGVNPIAREIGLFAVEGAPARMPMIFVLQ